MIDIDVVVAGGGHAGLMLAGGLLRSGITVAVIDPSPIAAIHAAPPDGRTLALMAGSRAIAERLGLWTCLAPVTSPIWHVHVEDAGSAARIDYRAAEDLRQPFGYGVENRHLRTAVLDAALAAGNERVLVQGRVAAFAREPAAMRVELDDGTVLRAALLVGADGRGSGVRQLARIALERWTYHQTALAFVIEHERPHGNAVRERLRASGPLALLPLPGNRSGVTWVEPHGTAEALAREGEAALGEVLTRLFSDVLGTCRVASPVGCWRLGAQHAARYVVPRLALVGDAAHGVHPIHAQGFNMAVGDIGALVRSLVSARRRGLDLGSADVLIPYERERRRANTRRLWLTDGLNRLFSNDLAPLALARGLGLRALDLLAPLKRAAIREGMGTG